MSIISIYFSTQSTGPHSSDSDRCRYWQLNLLKHRDEVHPSGTLYPCNRPMALHLQQPWLLVASLPSDAALWEIIGGAHLAPVLYRQPAGRPGICPSADAEIPP